MNEEAVIDLADPIILKSQVYKSITSILSSTFIFFWKVQGRLWNVEWYDRNFLKKEYVYDNTITPNLTLACKIK